MPESLKSSGQIGILSHFKKERPYKIGSDPSFRTRKIIAVFNQVAILQNKEGRYICNDFRLF